MLEKVTSKLLADLFLSEEFLENLSKASKITKETYNETGFLSCWDTNTEEISIGQVSEGNYLGMKTEGLKDTRGYQSLTGILLVDLHTHPLAKGPVFPSDGDLALVINGREEMIYDSKKDIWCDAKTKPICAIGKVRKKGDVELLIYNENNRLHEGNIESMDRKLLEYLGEKGIEPYEEEISKSKIKTSEIKELMNDSGYYNAEILNFPASMYISERRNWIRDSNLNKFKEKLEKFEHDIIYSDSDTSFIDSL